jgi:hypothetical protein
LGCAAHGRVHLQLAREPGSVADVVGGGLHGWWG